MLSPNSKNFRRYGKIISYPNKDSKGKVRNLWKIIHVEAAKVSCEYLPLKRRVSSMKDFLTL